MTDLDVLAAVAAAFFVVTVSPGPANLAVATAAMAAGRRAGMGMALGLSLGLGAWGLVAATGLGAVLQTSTTLLFALKIFGGLYLLWLAVQSARAAGRAQAPGTHAAAEGRWLRRGLILNLSNPKAVVAWMAALAVGLSPDGGLAQLAAATGICIALGFLNYLGHAWLFSTPRAMAAYARARRWIDGVAAALFAAAGLGLLRSAFARSPA